MGRPKGSVVPPDLKRSRNNLAVMLRENFHEQIFFDWLMMILMGKNPVIVKDDRCKTTNGYRVAADDKDLMAPSQERRDTALRELMNRRDGLPAQRNILEAEIRTTSTSTKIEAVALASLSPVQLGALGEALRGAIRGPVQQALTAPQENVEDAELVETEEQAA